MKILYADDGVYYAVYDADLFKFRHTTTIPLSTMEIDEISGNNQVVCADLKSTEGKFDASGQRKYYVENGELHAWEGWIEFVPPRPF